MNYVHVFYRLSVCVAASSVLALFLLLATPVTHGNAMAVPRLAPTTRCLIQVDHLPMEAMNGQGHFPPLGVPPAQKPS
jgi:hypothetical protein